MIKNPAWHSSKSRGYYCATLCIWMKELVVAPRLDQLVYVLHGSCILLLLDYSYNVSIYKQMLYKCHTWRSSYVTYLWISSSLLYFSIIDRQCYQLGRTTPSSGVFFRPWGPRYWWCSGGGASVLLKKVIYLTVEYLTRIQTFSCTCLSMVDT